MKSIEKDLAEQPAPQALLLSRAGADYVNLGDLPKADAVLSESLAAFRRADNIDPIEFARASSLMAWTRFRQNKPQQALRIVDDATASLEGDHSETARLWQGTLWSYRGLIHTELGDPLTGRKDFETSVSLLQGPNLAVAQRNYVAALQALDQYDEALTQANAAYSTFKSKYGENHSRTAGAAVTLASLSLDVGNIDVAANLASAIEPQYKKHFDEANIELFLAELMFGNLARAQHRYDDALAHFDAASKSLDGKVDADHPYHATPLLNAGLTEYERGNDKAALANLEQAVKIRVNGLAPSHPDLAQALDARGVVLARLCRTTEASADIEKALAIRQAKLPYQHSATVDSFRHAALIRFATGDIQGANALWAEARERANSAYLYRKKPELMRALQDEMANPNAAAAAFACR